MSAVTSAWHAPIEPTPVLDAAAETSLRSATSTPQSAGAGPGSLCSIRARRILSQAARLLRHLQSHAPGAGKLQNLQCEKGPRAQLHGRSVVQSPRESTCAAGCMGHPTMRTGCPYVRAAAGLRSPAPQRDRFLW